MTLDEAITMLKCRSIGETFTQDNFDERTIILEALEQLRKEREEFKEHLKRASRALTEMVNAAPHEGEGLQRIVACGVARRVAADIDAALHPTSKEQS